MSEANTKQWLTELVTTAQQRDYAAHMNLISKNVSVVGVPGFDNIGYQDWANHAAHEFKLRSHCRYRLTHPEQA